MNEVAGKAIAVKAIALTSLLLSCLSVAADTLVSGNGFGVTETDVSNELAYMPGAARKQVASDPSRLRALIDDIYRRAALAAAANGLGLQNRPDYAYRLHRAELEELVAIALEEQRRSALDRLPDFDRRAEEHHRAHAEDYRTPERVKVRHILRKVPACDQRDAVLAQLRQIRDRVEAGEELAELAKEYSEDSGSAKRGGELDRFERGEMARSFEEAAFALTEPGQLSPIVETRFGLHLIQLIERQEPRQKSFDEVRDSIVNKLKALYLRNEVEAWRHEIVDPAKADVNSAAIDAFVSRVIQLHPKQGAEPDR